jgi:hypothetical protein
MVHFHCLYADHRKRGSQSSRRLITLISVGWVPPDLCPSGACLDLGTRASCSRLTPPWAASATHEHLWAGSPPLSPLYRATDHLVTQLRRVVRQKGRGACLLVVVAMEPVARLNGPLSRPCIMQAIQRWPANVAQEVLRKAETTAANRTTGHYSGKGDGDRISDASSLPSC